MSKALVIKGADFTANRVAQIVITQVVPCTGLSLSQSTITFNALGATTQLTATKTTVDTTEQLSWSSSNENVATVVNGLVTCVGLGTATITATCGAQSATCSVTCSSVTVDLSEWAKLENHRLSNNKDYSTAPTQEYGYVRYSSTNILNGYKAFYGSESELDTRFPIPLPNGATSVSAVASDNTLSMDFHLFSATVPSEYRPSGSATYSALRCGRKGGAGSISYDFSSITTADSYVITVYHGSGATAADLSATIQLVFS